MQAAKKAGLPDSEIKALLQLSTSKEIKDKLKSSTQEAIDHGVSCPSALLADSGTGQCNECHELYRSFYLFPVVWLPDDGVSRRWET